MAQSRRGSLIEAVTNTVVGYALAVATQFAVFPAFGLQVGVVENLGLGLVFTGVTYVDATVGGKRLQRGARLWSVATSTFKAETYRFLRQERPTVEEIAAGASFPAGTVHLPSWADAEWLKQLTAEQLITVKSRRGFSKLEWQKLRERNEALDCRVYARAAAWIVGADRWSEARWADLEDQLGVAKTDETDAGPGALPRAQGRTAPLRRTMRSSYMG